MAKSLYLLSWRIAPCEVLAGFDTRHDTPPFKSRHHPNSRIAQSQDPGSLDGEAGQPPQDPSQS